MATTNGISSAIELDQVGLRKHYLTLTKCQKPFVRLLLNWIKQPRKLLLVVSGGPGTGKSYVVKNTLDCVKTLQLRMSYTARSAQAIGGRTIHSTVYLNWSKGSICDDLENKLEEESDLVESIKKSRKILKEFNCELNPYIIVVDEVAMINGWLMYWLIRYFMDRTELPLLFICMGDPHQLNPVKSIHNLFSITFSEKKYEVRKIHLTESKRFVPEYEKLINRIRDYVDKGDETGLFTFVCDNFPVVESIDGIILKRANRAMAFKNDRVKKYNSFYIKNMMMGPEIKLSEDFIVKSGCMVFVTKNVEATNGTLLIFERYNVAEDVAVCKDPKTNLEVKISRNKNGKFPLDLGFAGTVHKFQGDTIDNANIVISFNGNRNLNLVYTALSRVRQMNQIISIEL